MPDIKNLLEFTSSRNSAAKGCSDIITIIDLNSKLTFCNKAFLNLFGLDENKKDWNKNIGDLLKDKEGALIIENFERVLKEKKTVSFIINFELIKTIVKMTMFPLIKNGILKGVLAFSTDITKEEQLKKSLTEKIMQLDSLISSMPVLAYMKDKNLNYIAGSKYAKNFLEKGLDAYASNIKLDVKDASRITDMEDSYVIHNKKTLIREKQLKAEDGKEYWYKVYKSPVFDADKNVNGVVSVAQNIDEEKKQDKNKELFVAALAHDLKNPLQAQIVNLKLLTDGKFGKVNEPQKQILDMIIESADFMHKMLYSVLSVYKYASGSVKLEKSKFCIDNLVQKCIKESLNLASERSIKFKYTAQTPNIDIYADESQIRRIIVNLINNAVQYSYSNSLIDISVKKEDKKVIIYVKNLSSPISADIKEQIFNKYVSKRDCRKKGTGLGLYYSQQVARAHKGKILLVTNGSENNFILELPLYSPEQDTLDSYLTLS